jgi:hypothetical protein
MPCRSDYLEQNNREAELQRAAKLYVYVLKQLKEPVPEYAADAADDYYCDDDKPLIELCSTLTKLKRKDKQTFETIVYNAKNATSRDLAGWWEQHRAADLKRARAERAKKRKAELRKKAVKKLTKAERAALDLE